MSPVRIIGVGSPLGLDRVGWEVVNALEGRGLADSFPAGAIALSVWDRPGSLLVQALGDAPGVILIDAMRAGEAAGAVRRLTPGELISAPGGFVSSHDVGIPQALALAEALGGLPQRTVIYGIEIGEGQGTAMSLEALVDGALARLEPALRADLQGWLESPTPRSN